MKQKKKGRGDNISSTWQKSTRMTKQAIELLESSRSSAWRLVLVSDGEAVVGTIILGMLARNASPVTHETMKQISKGTGLGTGKLQNGTLES